MKENDLPGRVIISRVYRDYISEHALKLSIVFLLMIIGAAATAGQAWLIQPILDDVFIKKDMAQLALIAIATVSVFCVRGFSEFLHLILLARVELSISRKLRYETGANLLRADLAYFHATSTGALVAGCINNIEKLRETFSTTLQTMVRDALTIVFLIALIFHHDVMLAIVCLVILPIATIPIVVIGRRVRARASRAWQELERVSGYFSELFRGVRHIKAYGQEKTELKRLESRVSNLSDVMFKTARTAALTVPAMDLLMGIATAGAIAFGGYRVITDSLTPGEFFSFITAFILAYKPLKSVGTLNNLLQEGLAVAQRVIAILDIRPTIGNAPDAKPLTIDRGVIELDRVSFSYGEIPALRDVSIRVPAGATVALVGPSGAGKSTLLNLIPRLYDVNEGSVSIDGMDLRNATIESVRDSIAFVSQDSTLFNDTVAANIAFARPGAMPEDIRRAGVEAGAHDFIVALPQGYDTIVGEDGIRLSGGQKQRISIARAILRDAPIILLDEATSSLDSESERQVQQSLMHLASDRTCLIVSHRISSIVKADLIYVIDDGCIVETGDHAALMRNNALYAHLYRQQDADFRQHHN